MVGVTMMSLGHPNSNRSSTSSYEDKNYPVEASLYFDELQLKYDTITIFLDALPS